MTATQTRTVLNSQALLDHWQGHRRLTRRLIESFPEDKLFSFKVGSMRPFTEMVKEFLKMTAPVAHGVATGEWKEFGGDLDSVRSKAELLRLWDEATERLNEIWPTIPAHRFAEVDKAFGQWENSGINTILYCIDNEIHHRGQACLFARTGNRSATVLGTIKRQRRFSIGQPNILLDRRCHIGRYPSIVDRFLRADDGPLGDCWDECDNISCRWRLPPVKHRCGKSSKICDSDRCDSSQH